MPTYYVRSTDGDNASDGLSWANAEADLHTPSWAAGDTIYVSDNHAQSTAAAITIDGNGTLASPTKILCVDDAAEPPTALAATGTVTTTGANNINLADNLYVHGIGFYAGSSTSAASIQFNQAGNGAKQTFQSCHFELANSSSSSRIIVYETGMIELYDCTFKFGSTSQTIPSDGYLFIRGGSVLSGGSTPTAMFTTRTANRYTKLLVEGFDFSNLATTFNIFNAAATSVGSFVTIRNCKLPDSWSGSLASGTLGVFQRIEMYNCDSADTNYRLWIEDYFGSIKHSDSVFNDAGATNGTSRISWVMVSGANAEYPHQTLATPEIVKWNETTGSQITATVEIVHNSAGGGTNGVMMDDEIWLEVQYLGTSGRPISSFITDTCAIFGTAAAQDTSSASWTGDAAGWDTQKLSVSFTPQEKGYIHARVHLAKASATVYVDPLITIA